jgi:hypothetical protein
LTKAICNDYWARGIHELALADTSGAIASWTEAQDYAISAACEEDRPVTVDVDGPFLVVLTSGYLGLARWIAGDAAGEEQYDGAVAALQSKLATQDIDEAKLALGQLQKTWATHGPRTP